jgi:hypothetical protein
MLSGVNPGEQLARGEEAWRRSRPVSVRAQSVLYRNSYQDIDRSLASLARSADLAVSGGACSGPVHVRLGDSSPMPCLSNSELTELQRTYRNEVVITYDFFGENLGSARGHNRLAASGGSDFLLIYNPNVIASPVLLQEMLKPFENGGIGIVEAKQLPLEHPKEYDRQTGETGWATTACALTPAELFHRVGEFDADSFFMYCDDVDYSWRVRLAGFKVIFQPSAVVFHDKRLSTEGTWQPTTAEHYYSAEAGLMLAHKWSRPELVTSILSVFNNSDNELWQKAAKNFESKRAAGALPEPLDPQHTVGEFVDGMYARHRYEL